MRLQANEPPPCLRLTRLGGRTLRPCCSGAARAFGRRPRVATLRTRHGCGGSTRRRSTQRLAGWGAGAVAQLFAIRNVAIR